MSAAAHEPTANQQPGDATGASRVSEVHESDFERTLATGPICHLAVDNPCGSIRVAGWDRPEVWIRARRAGEAGALGRYQSTRVELSQDGSRVRLRSVHDRRYRFGDATFWQDLAQEAVRAPLAFLRQISAPEAIDYEISVPRGSTLDLSGISSAIAVEGVDGDVKASTVSGENALWRASGRAELTSVSGAILVGGATGRLKLRSTGGTIELAGAPSAIDATSVSGSILFDGRLEGGGERRFKTVSGSMTLRLPPDSRASFDAEGISKHVSGELPVAVGEDSHRPAQRVWRATLNGGGPTVSFRTVSGELRLARADTSPPSPAPPAATPPLTDPTPAPATPPADATPTTAPPSTPLAGEWTPREETEQMRILRALEKGEITVDDAMRRLEELRGR